MCPEKRQAFANISLTRNTVADRNLGADLDSQMEQEVKSFVETLTVTKEFLELVPTTDTTTANDNFNSLVGALDRVGKDWTRAVSLATDRAPSMIGKKAGVVIKFREKVQAANGGHDFWTCHCIFHQEALCCEF